uniref:Reverse transcriptase domain-containing protein n=1 Tax=Nicotiana tabacum TaxID=4097 RepID=A0A1S4B2L9_TOBAC|nr:uncharacterized protein LOC104092037 [Nicotiana tomentosiformis]XP_016483177.1 PREDICTED: uncharacterized protein LOC107803898 [Nicotiana tabacum]
MQYIDSEDEEHMTELHKAQTQYTRWLKAEETMLKQKANIKWLEEGDSNSKYFHAIINERRRRLTLHKIKTQDGQWLQGTKRLPLGQLNTLKIWDKNDNLCVIPGEKEIKDVVFSMDKNSAPGPDGFGGAFYQGCWEIIKQGLVEIIQTFFNGNSLTRLAPILPKIISENQSGFVSGRLITKNILLAQEIVHDINKENEGGNMMIELDMAKAYYRVNWDIILAALRKFGFSKA